MEGATRGAAGYRDWGVEQVTATVHTVQTNNLLPMEKSVFIGVKVTKIRHLCLFYYLKKKMRIPI